VPPHVGLELLDVVDLDDEHLALSGELRRVTGIRWRYDRQRALYEQEIAIGPR
jgi:hypothetical protein